MLSASLFISASRSTSWSCGIAPETGLAGWFRSTRCGTSSAHCVHLKKLATLAASLASFTSRLVSPRALANLKFALNGFEPTTLLPATTSIQKVQQRAGFPTLPRPTSTRTHHDGSHFVQRTPLNGLPFRVLQDLAIRKYPDGDGGNEHF